jgi:hypothetical protein
MSNDEKRKDVLNPVEGKDGKTYWTRVGVAFLSKDTESLVVHLEQLPINGKLVIRDPRQSAQAGA